LEHQGCLLGNRTQFGRGSSQECYTETERNKNGVGKGETTKRLLDELGGMGRDRKQGPENKRVFRAGSRTDGNEKDATKEVGKDREELHLIKGAHLEGLSFSRSEKHTSLGAQRVEAHWQILPFYRKRKKERNRGTGGREGKGGRGKESVERYAIRPKAVHGGTVFHSS